MFLQYCLERAVFYELLKVICYYEKAELYLSLIDALGMLLLFLRCYQTRREGFRQLLRSCRTFYH